jgi:puromycin-sensitive aminopeptidase
VGQLDERERLSLVSDTWAETVSGLLALESPLTLWSRLGQEMDPDVWWALAGGLGLLEIVADESQVADLAHLVQRLAAGPFAEVGWSSADDPARSEAEEPPRRARLRARLVTLLGTVGQDEGVRAEARRRLADADAGRAPLSADLATAVARVVAAGGGSEEWDVLHAHYKSATTPQDEVRYLDALGLFSGPELVRRSVELAFSDEVRTQDAPYFLGSILGRRNGCAIAWEAIEQHWDEMFTRWPPKSVHRMLEWLPGLAAAGDEMAQRAFAWLDAHPLGKGERRVVQARERLHINLKFKQRATRELGSALAATRPGAR